MTLGKVSPTDSFSIVSFRGLRVSRPWPSLAHVGDVTDSFVLELL